MFLRTIRRRGLRYLVLLESFREQGKVRQRVVHYFGRDDLLDWPEVRKTLAKYPGFRYLDLDLPT